MGIVEWANLIGNNLTYKILWFTELDSRCDLGNILVLNISIILRFYGINTNIVFSDYDVDFGISSTGDDEYDGCESKFGTITQECIEIYIRDVGDYYHSSIYSDIFF